MCLNSTLWKVLIISYCFDTYDNIYIFRYVERIPIIKQVTFLFLNTAITTDFFIIVIELLDAIDNIQQIADAVQKGL